MKYGIIFNKDKLKSFAKCAAKSKMRYWALGLLGLLNRKRKGGIH